jgi:hypothetical protein
LQTLDWFTQAIFTLLIPAIVCIVAMAMLTETVIAITLSA